MRSDGRIKNSGGVIALCEIVSEPYENEEDFKVDLKVLECRLTAEEQMLFRHELKEIPDTMNLQIFKISQMTNYRLTDDEFNRLKNLWNSPSEIEDRLNLSTTEKFLHFFKDEDKTGF